VSNFGAKHIQEFIDQKVPLPTVNQIDLHPFMRHPEIVKICEDNGILLEVSVVTLSRTQTSLWLRSKVSSDGLPHHSGWIAMC
jgi:diketogulonate reductase-like aldo/keto reductase